MNKKLTLIKVMPNYGSCPTTKDLERWRGIFRQNLMTPEQAEATGEVEITTLPEKQDGEYYVTIVRIGSENYHPTSKDLEAWRDVFKDAQDDPDFKIFTSPDVEISVINIGKIIAVE